MQESTPFVYQQATIDFVTAAAQTCLLIEHCAESERAEFVDKLLCLLPLLYLRTRLLPSEEAMTDETPQQFVQEEDYNYVQAGIRQLLGTDDAYLEVFVDDMRYSDEPITAYISENIADIYQELKDMAAAFQTGQEAVMHDAVVACKESFREHWGQKLLNAMRALHALSQTLTDEEA